MNINLLLEELLKNSKKFVAEIKVWDEYPKDASYFALAAFLEKVIIPTIEFTRTEESKPITGQVPEDISWMAGSRRRGSNTPKTTKLRGE